MYQTCQAVHHLERLGFFINIIPAFGNVNVLLSNGSKRDLSIINCKAIVSLMSKEIIKKIITEVANTATESGFTAVATAAGYPMLSIAVPLVKGTVLGLIENCYNDCSQRTLSIRESKKFDRVSMVAMQTFRELAEKDGVVAWELNMNLDYFDYAFEVAEHMTLEAIRQSEQSKVDVLGRYYGHQFYKASTDWQDMHQVITMIGMLTLRQIVMIRLISDGFKGIDNNLFISNPSACIEMHRLLDYGIWQTEGASFGINDSWTIQLKSIIPTIYSDRIREDLMLDSLSEKDLARTIDSLHLTTDGAPLEVLTKEDYDKNKNALTWGEF